MGCAEIIRSATYGKLSQNFSLCMLRNPNGGIEV
jgi:hypothetical protein